MFTQTNTENLATAQENDFNETPDLETLEGVNPFSDAASESEFTPGDWDAEFFSDTEDRAGSADRCGEGSGAPDKVIRREIKEGGSAPVLSTYKPGRAESSALAGIHQTLGHHQSSSSSTNVPFRPTSQKHQIAQPLTASLQDPISNAPNEREEKFRREWGGGHVWRALLHLRT